MKTNCSIPGKPGLDRHARRNWYWRSCGQKVYRRYRKNGARQSQRTLSTYGKQLPDLKLVPRCMAGKTQNTIPTADTYRYSWISLQGASVSWRMEKRHYFCQKFRICLLRKELSRLIQIHSTCMNVNNLNSSPAQSVWLTRSYWASQLYEWNSISNKRHYY